MTELWINDDDPDNCSNSSGSKEEDQGSRLIKAYVMFLFAWQSLFIECLILQWLCYSLFFAIVFQLVSTLTLSKKA